MLDNQVHSLDYNAIVVRFSSHSAALAVDLVAGDDAMYRASDLAPFAACLGGIAAGDNLDGVALFYPFHLLSYLSAGAIG